MPLRSDFEETPRVEPEALRRIPWSAERRSESRIVSAMLFLLSFGLLLLLGFVALSL